MKEEYWTTKKGKRIAVSDMDEDHVRHCLRMLIRYGNERKEEADDIWNQCDANESDLY